VLAALSSASKIRILVIRDNGGDGGLLRYALESLGERNEPRYLTGGVPSRFG